MICAAAYQRAFATDPTSAFGGIIAFNRELDAAAAEAVLQQFVEVVIAPRVGDAALKPSSPPKPTYACWKSRWQPAPTSSI